MTLQASTAMPIGLTVEADPGGGVEYAFEGRLHAEGVDMPAWEGAADDPAAESQIAWRRESDALVPLAGDVYVTDDGVVRSVRLRAHGLTGDVNFSTISLQALHDDVARALFVARNNEGGVAPRRVVEGEATDETTQTLRWKARLVTSEGKTELPGELDVGGGTGFLFKAGALNLWNSNKTTLVHELDAATGVRFGFGGLVFQKLRLVTINEDLPSLAAHTGTTRTLVAPAGSIAVGDVIVALGHQGVYGAAITWMADPIATTADRIVLRVFNADSVVLDVGAAAYHFLVFNL